MISSNNSSQDFEIERFMETDRRSTGFAESALSAEKWSKEEKNDDEHVS